jgi:arylsulfatase A-like enzyme
MRLIYFDIDTLRADHLGAYGYHRDTSPNIDALAARGVRFDQMYASDTPCLPSRTALFSGRFGITNGVVNHGGARADPFPEGRDRGLRTELGLTAFPSLMRAVGMRTITVSTFGERHSAYHWYAGFNEIYNLGSGGRETADEVATVAIDWLRRHGKATDWFLHVHLWDPHIPYRTPESFGDPFAAVDPPGWLTEEVRRTHWGLPGPHSAQEVLGFGPSAWADSYRRQPHQIDSLDQVRRMFDGYDTAVRYADEHVGRVLDEIVTLGLLDETAVMVSSDHGETLGELGIYCDHQTADLHTHRLPLILAFPGVVGGRSDTALRYQVDAAATILQLLGADAPERWDGKGFADELHRQESHGRDYLVLSHAAWTSQRSVRFAQWLCIRTYESAFHAFPEVLLFDVVSDPHEQHDQAAERPDVVDHCLALLGEWQADAMLRSRSGVDPMATVVAEGGGWYARGKGAEYTERLRQTGRGEWAARLGPTP